MIVTDRETGLSGLPDGPLSGSRETAWRRVGFLAVAIVLLGAISGCAPEPRFRLNSVHLLTLEKSVMGAGESVSAENRQQLGELMTAMFGTPNEPWFPDFLPADDPIAGLINLEHLKVAAGPVSSQRGGEAHGLYREHCAHCHGVTGDGAGPTAGFLNPYPRDFRLGKYKFKSTPLSKVPTDADLDRIISNGIAGTAMPSFKSLPQSEIDILVEYVKYLSIRGQVERRVMSELVQLNDDEPLLASRETDVQAYKNQLTLILEDCFLEVADRWVDPERNITHVPELPVAFMSNRLLYVDEGQLLFFGAANCVQCHGPTGSGDGQTENYDDWTNEWLKGANIDGNNPHAIAEFVRAGAFPPRKLRPRNLRMRVLRGGNRLEDVFRRVANGIEGTSMPASTTLSDEQIWSLVAYILEIPFAELTDE